ncbi:MAG: hypothetical protein A2176_09855 [Spirochaetes bacterium RBG_13_51_14]|nr:MAG: hypothetical protein A2176_09855 [Spirochaetes bacterium RBG_13_51_14]
MSESASTSSEIPTALYMAENSGPAAGTGSGGRRHGNRAKKKLFPFGIFFMLFFMESIIAAGAVFSYFLFAGTSRIAEIESNTRSYSIPLAEAFGSMAEMSYRTKRYARLRTLFRKKIGERIIDEAFFVLRDGRLIAHSDPVIEKNLKGNLASDEWAYNLDLILKPVYQKSREVFFTDYNFVSKPVPFDRWRRNLLKTYFYRNIDPSGWLVSRAVFGKKKPVGAVSFIISKERMYSFIAGHIIRCVRLLELSMAVAFVVSLLVSLVVLMRYRSIQKRTLAWFGGDAFTVRAAAVDGLSDMTVAASRPAPGSDGEPLAVELPDIGEMDESDAAVSVDGSPFGPGREIKDAIPVREKE